MQIIEVPIYNEDGSVRVVQKLAAEEAQHLLQFALNFLVSSGLAANYAVQKAEEESEDGQLDLPLDDMPMQ
jgi:hypothetical protein